MHFIDSCSIQNKQHPMLQLATLKVVVMATTTKGTTISKSNKPPHPF